MCRARTAGSIVTSRTSLCPNPRRDGETIASCRFGALIARPPAGLTSGRFDAASGSADLSGPPANKGKYSEFDEAKPSPDQDTTAIADAME